MLKKKRGPKTIGGKGAAAAAPVRCTMVEARTAKGLSLFRLSQMTGLTVQALQQYESGKNWPSPKRLFLLAYILEQAPEKLWPELEHEALAREFGLTV